jgi:hypothetical protein
MYHESQNTHLGGTAVVELDATLSQLGRRIEFVPAKVNEAVTEVANEFVSSSWHGLHEANFHGENEEKDLGNTGSRDGAQRSEAIRDVGKFQSGVVNVSRETDAVLRREVSNNSNHGDTAVLDLNVSETVEPFLVTVGNQAEGVEEAKRNLGTELVLEGHVGGDRGTGGILGRGESGGGGDDGGDDDRLHGGCCVRLDYSKGRNCNRIKVVWVFGLPVPVPVREDRTVRGSAFCEKDTFAIFSSRLVQYRFAIGTGL